MNATPEKVGPDVNPAPCQTHIGGGVDKLKSTTPHRLLHVLDRWYPWIMLADGIVVVVLLASLTVAVQP